MSNVVELPDQDSIEEEASLWIARLDRGLAAEEKVAFQRWVTSNVKHKEMLYAMAELWDNMSVLQNLSDLFPLSEKRQAMDFRSLSALAASILVVVGIVFSGLFYSSDITKLFGNDQVVVPAYANHYETAIGEYSTVTLPDGSELTLNTNSLVKVNYANGIRGIELVRGELNIDVAHDQSRPLIVSAGKRMVRAVGTAFNIQINKDQTVELIVTEGKVVVSKQNNRGLQSGEFIDPTTQAQRIPVTQGEMLIMGVESEAVSQIAPGQVDISLSWQSGNLVFAGETLEDAIDEISRYTSVKFEFRDSSIKGLKVAGLFKAGDVNGLLATLEENFQIQGVRKNEGLISLGKLNSLNQ